MLLKLRTLMHQSSPLNPNRSVGMELLYMFAAYLLTMYIIFWR